jgi:acyl-CoA reductase-like NAD-dependent aldehyde dehydrogenase
LTKPDRDFPVGSIASRWVYPDDHEWWEQRNPSAWQEIIGRVPQAAAGDVVAAAAAAQRAQREWAKSSLEARGDMLLAWASKLFGLKDELAATMALEIGKPISLGDEEVRFAVDLLRAAARGLDADCASNSRHKKPFTVRRCPIGVVGIITPWNNPVAIPVGKLGPAIAYGNGIVWKPALSAPRTSIAVFEALGEARCPVGLVNLLFGEKETARCLVSEPKVQAVSFTGSAKAGKIVARLSSRWPKPVQLELGGNNAALIMPDVNLERAGRELAASAFSFSGQRCTAPRRFIVHRKCRKRFEEALVSAIRSLRLGSPQDPSTQVGPLISRQKQREMLNLVRQSRSAGAKVLCGGRIPERWKEGCWFEPTVVFSRTPDLSVVQQESFGPVTVLLAARDFDHALDLLNGVPQGLVASLYSEDCAFREQFLERAECGVLKLNQTTLGVSPDFPFGGWKASGMGPFEHGSGDREFYTRPQTVYG